MDDPKSQESGLPADCPKLSEKPLCYGDRVYVTIEIEEQEYILQYFDHLLQPQLVPLADRGLMLHCLFQLKEGLVVGSRAEKFTTEKRRGEPVKPGSRITLLHIVSSKYLNINFREGVESDFGSRLTTMDKSACAFLRAALQSSHESFQEEFSGRENLILKVDETRDYFSLCATGGSHPVPYFGSKQSVWRMHVYDRISPDNPYVMPYGVPFRLHSNYSGKYLSNVAIDEDIKIAGLANVLHGLWIIEAPDGLTGSPGNDSGFVRLQHFETRRFFTADKRLSADQPAMVKFNTFPLRIDNFVTMKTDSGFLRVKETLDLTNLKNYILSRVPGVQSLLDVEFNNVITKPEMYQFEIIRPGSAQVAALCELEGLRTDLRLAGERIQAFYEDRDESKVDTLDLESVARYFASIKEWLDEAKESYFLPEFLQMVIDFDVHYEISRIITYSSCLLESGFQQFNTVMDSLEKLTMRGDGMWKVMEEPRFRKLMVLAPAVWTKTLTVAFSDMHTSGTVALICISTLAPHFLCACHSSGKLPQEIVDCIKSVMSSVKTQYSDNVVMLEDVPLAMKNSVSTPVTFCGKEYRLEELDDIGSVFELYTHFARKLVFPAFEKLRDKMLGDMTGKSKNILDTCVLTSFLNKDAIIIGRLQNLARLIRLNILLKCRSDTGKITVQYASEVVCACPDFVQAKDEVFDVELQKWEQVRTIINYTSVKPHWVEELFDFAAGCLFAMDYLVAHFQLSTVHVQQTIQEVYCFLSGYAVHRRHPPLPSHWSADEIHQLQEATTRTKVSVPGVKHCFAQALSLLKNCVRYFQLHQLGSQGRTTSPFTSAYFMFGKGRGKPVFIKCELLQLLQSLVDNVTLFPFMKDHIEDIAYLIGAIHEFDQIVQASQARVTMISSQVAQQVCSSMDALVALDLLAQKVRGEELSIVRLREVKDSLRTLNGLLPDDGDVAQFSCSQRMLSAVNLTDSLLVLIELTKSANDSELLSLLLRLIVKMCVQHPENKARIRDHLHSLDFAYYLPEFIELLDEFGFLADIDVGQLRLLVTVMIRRFIEEGGKIDALNRLADVFKSVLPLFVIAMVIIEAVAKWTSDETQQRELLSVLWKLASLDVHLKRSLQLNQEVRDMLERLGISLRVIGLDSGRGELSKMRSLTTLSKQQLEESLDASKKQDFEVQMSNLSKIHLTGHKVVLERLEQVDGIHFILDSFQSLSGAAAKPLYFTAVQLFKLMGNAKKRAKAHVHFSQASIDSVMLSGLDQVLVYSLLLSKSPRFTLMLLRCLRTLMQVNSDVVKEEILSVLKRNKHYFIVFSEFSRVCQQYLAEVHKGANPQFNIVVEYLKFFTTGCDLCTVNFQNFMREQIVGSSTNINILQIALSLMSAVGDVIRAKLSLEQSVSIQHKQMIRYLMTFMTEAISGPNIDNQVAVGTKKILYLALNAVLDSLLKDKDKDELQEDEKPTASALMALLCALLEKLEKEGAVDQSEVLKTMGKNLELNSLRKFMVLIRKKCPGFHDIGVRLCIFLCDFKKKAEGLVEEEDETKLPDLLDTVQYFSNFIGNVEIEKEKVIYSVLFPIDDQTKYLTPFTKELLLGTIHKQPLRQEKLDDMLSGVKTCAVEISILANRPNWLLKWSPYWLVANRLSFGFAILINLLLIIYIRGTFHHDRMFMPAELAFAITVLGLAQCACYSFGMFLYWNLYYYTLFYPIVAKSSGQDIKELANDEKLNSFHTPFSSQDDLQEGGPKKQLQTGNIVQLLYNIGFLGISICCIFYPPIYAMLLLGVFSQNERFDTIIKALSTNWQMLGVTAILMCIIIYEFSMVAYLFFYSYYNSQTNLECDDLFNCFISTLNIGLQGGLGDSLAELTEDDYWERLLFDVTFQIIIMMVFLNVVFGIIIDAFGDLRDERTGIEADVNNNCLICGRDRSTIDLRGETWQRHITQVHSYEMYLSFMLYIYSKNIEDCSGIEKYVKDHISSNSVSFMPTTSMELKKNEIEADEQEELEANQRYADISRKVTEMLMDESAEIKS